MEYTHHIDLGVSAFRRGLYIFKEIMIHTPVKTCSSSTSDPLKKVNFSPERSTVLPPMFSIDKYESLHVQSEHLDGTCTIYLTKSLEDAVHKLREHIILL
jgi:hypothetical protein